MLNVLVITFPFFALVLCGYIATRGRVLPLASIPGLNAFVLFFALPCMLYRFGSTTPLAQLFNPGVIAVYLLCSLIVVSLSVAITKSVRIDWNNAAFGALVAVFPNTGFMGVPLLVALLGAGAAGPVIATITVDMVAVSSVCIAISRLDGAGRHNIAEALRSVFRGMVTNPMPWSILLGALASATAFQLPRPVGQVVELLSNAASPVALFSIGAVLARSQMNRDASPHGKLVLRDYLPLAFIKLVIQPLLVWCVGKAAIALGLPLDPFSLLVLVLLAALPSASNVILLAERFGADNGRIARVILVTTTLAFLTFSAAVALMT